ncbi:MAG: rod shape-determining protein [Victivallales bacterium]|nr:rod shape-determining protein [Victivallales bacterium]
MCFEKFKGIRNFFVNDIGIDLGTMNTLVCVRDRGIVLNEPSYVAINADTNKVRAVGNDAKRMMGRTAERIKVIRPMRDGVIADAGATDEMLRIFIKKAARFKLYAPRVLIAVPSGINEVGVRAVKESAIAAGARAVRLVEEPFASAVGVGLPVHEPDSNMIVDIGGGTTEVAIISLSCIVACNSVKCGGDGMDSAIITYMNRKHNLLIGPNWAERIKIEIGSAYPLKEKLTMEVKGMDYNRQGDRLPRAVVIDSDEIREALSEPVASIVKTIRKTIDAAPPELAARLIDNGITLAGGGSLLRGLDRLIEENTNLPTRVAENPLQAVVNGTSKLLENANELFSQPQNSLIGNGERH